MINGVAIIGDCERVFGLSYTYIYDVNNPYSTGIDFSCQNLTSADVRFWRLKSIPAL